MERTALATPVWKWLRIGQPGVVRETMTSTTPPSRISTERTMSSSTMLRRSSGSMTLSSALRMSSLVMASILGQSPERPGEPEAVEDRLRLRGGPRTPGGVQAVAVPERGQDLEQPRVEGAAARAAGGLAPAL